MKLLSRKLNVRILIGVVLAGVLSAIPTMAASATGLNNFVKANTYVSGQFTDVPSSAWFAKSVGNAYQYGVMVGSSNTTFNPDGNITVAEAITVGVQLHSTYYNDKYQPSSMAGAWYQPYVDYALGNGIISQTYPNYNKAATRAEFACIMAKAFPDEAFFRLNNIEDGDIPDVAKGSYYYNAVYKLYRAGVISGSDEYGTFMPDSAITRAQAATILGNLIDLNSRKIFSLDRPLVALEGLELAQREVVLEVGQTYQLDVTIKPANANYQTGLIWTITNPEVATVSQTGVVKALSPGMTAISVSGENNRGAGICIVYVEASFDEPTVITLPQNIFYLKVGDSARVSMEVYPETREPGFKWYTKNPDIVTVEPWGFGGYITALHEGIAHVYVETDDGATGYCAVVVEKSTSSSTQPPVDTRSELDDFYTFYLQHDVNIVVFRPIGFNGSTAEKYLTHYNTATALRDELIKFEVILAYSGDNPYILRYIQAVSTMREGVEMCIQGGNSQDGTTWLRGVELIRDGLGESNTLIQILIDAGYQ